MASIQLFVHPVRVPLVRPFVTAVRSASELETVLVQAVDPDGRSGWGEAPISRVTQASTQGVRDAVQGPMQDLLSTLDSAEPLEIAARLSSSGAGGSGGNAALMAVDCALYDLAAQQGGVPLYALLGGAKPQVLTDMTLSVAEPDELAKTAAEHLAAGFDCIKVKLNADGDQLRRMRAVREAVGPAVRLRVDANQAFSAAEAITVVRGFEDAGLNLELVEQPVRAGAWDDLARVTAQVDTPIMADESVWTVEDVREVIRRRAADMVNIKLAKTGGLHAALQLRTLAAEAGLGIIIGCMVESVVGISAAASLASAIDTAAQPADGGPRQLGAVPQDLDGGLWLQSSPVRGGAHYTGNAIVLSGAPGLGFAGLEQTRPSHVRQ